MSAALKQALELGLDAAHQVLAERKSALAGYPHMCRLEQRAVDKIATALAALEAEPQAPGALSTSTDQGRCGQCLHWAPRKPSERGNRLGLGECRAAYALWDSVKWKDDGEGEEWAPGHETATAFVQDGSDYKADLLTKPEHGCTMFAKEEQHEQPQAAS